MSLICLECKKQGFDKSYGNKYILKTHKASDIHLLAVKCNKLEMLVSGGAGEGKVDDFEQRQALLSMEMKYKQQLLDVEEKCRRELALGELRYKKLVESKPNISRQKKIRWLSDCDSSSDSSSDSEDEKREANLVEVRLVSSYTFEKYLRGLSELKKLIGGITSDRLKIVNDLIHPRIIEYFDEQKKKISMENYPPTKEESMLSENYARYVCITNYLNGHEEEATTVYSDLDIDSE